MKRSLLLSHPCQLDHGITTHPENTQRLEVIFETLKGSPYINLLNLSIPRLATKEELTQVHTHSYVEYILSKEGHDDSIDHETLLTPGSVKAARSAAGLGIELLEQLLKGEICNGFALLRPPGHHARPEHGMGFCIFNNIAISAKKALSMGVKRIMILDWDVHHGNGTQECFYEDDRVLFIDLHQGNLFPSGSGLLNETGKGNGLGFTINVPLPPGCADADYLYIFDTLVKPLAFRYQPELILVSAGFDAHESDPLGFMKLTTDGYGKLAEKVNALAKEICGGKILFFLEGGYNPYFLAKNVQACVKNLTQELVLNDFKTPKASGHVQHLIQEIHALHF